jgi:hypothetical protein
MTPRIPPPGPLEHDEEGDPLPQPAPASDLADLIQLAEWARQKDFAITGPIRVGKIEIAGFSDIRMLRKHGMDRPRSAEPEPSIGETVGVPDYAPGSE